MTRLNFIGILICLSLIISSIGCIDSNPSARASSEQQSRVDEIIKLLEGNIDEEIILTYIANHKLKQNLNANELVSLKKAGASDAILAMMLESPLQITSSEFPFKLTDDYKVGPPIEHKGLSIYPIYLEKPMISLEFLTLDEAEDLDTVIITEKESSSVPTVIIENTGQIPIYVCAGEVIFGGKQDRMIAHDVIISPQASLDVKVRCVESGRWYGSSGNFLSSGYMGSSKVRDAVQFQTQSDVWKTVAEQNADIEARTDTGTYRAALTHDEVQNLYEEFAEAILNKLEGENLVGMIVAANGKILSIDIFLSPSLFDKLKDKLLKAGVLDIIGIENEEVPPPGKEQIIEFYTDAVHATSQKLQDYEQNTNIMRESTSVTVNESVDRNNPSQIYHQNIIQKQEPTPQESQQVFDYQSNSDINAAQYQQIMQ